MSTNILFYIHDPMCAWCWAFRPAWQEIRSSLPGLFHGADNPAFDTSLSIEYVLGGLAPDSDIPMPADMRDYVKSNWQRIQEVVPSTEFNYDFWKDCQPRRSTYPACRAVVAAKKQGPQYEALMIQAIQDAYYLQASNPSDENVLQLCATKIGLDEALFLTDLRSTDTQQQLEDNIMHYLQLAGRGVTRGFPSLVLSIDDHCKEVPIDYNQPQVSTDFIASQFQ